MSISSTPSHPTPVHTTLPGLRRVVVGCSLILAPAAAMAGVLVEPTWPSTPDGFVSMLATSAGAAVSMQIFVISQLFWLIGLVGLGHATSRMAPVLGTAGAALAALGAFGHVVVGSAPIALAPVARSAVANGTLDQAAMVIQQAQTGLVPYMIVGTLGTIGGCVALVIAMIRSRLTSVWVTVLLLVSLVAEYALSDLGRWAELAAALAVLIAFAATGWSILRGGLGDWQTVGESSAVRPAAEATLVELVAD